MVGVTYRARLRDPSTGQVADRVAVFEAFDGAAQVRLATTNADGTFDLWAADVRTIGTDRVVTYQLVERGVADRGSGYLV